MLIGVIFSLFNKLLSAKNPIRGGKYNYWLIQYISIDVGALKNRDLDIQTRQILYRRLRSI